MKVLITPRGFASHGLEQIARMDELGIAVDYNDTGAPYDAETFLEKARDADGIIVGVDICDRSVMELCPKLKVVCKFGVGTDNIDLAYAEKRGISVGRTVGSNALSVAEHVMALMFADAKQLYPVIRNVKAGGWEKPTGIELAGKTLGIVGFGAIGRCLARIARGIGMDVVAYDAFPIDEAVAAEHGARIVSLDELLDCSDYVSLHVPLIDGTRNMIGTPQLARMKRSACLVNAARGGVVHEQELYDALAQGEIRSACFDVFSDEPPAADCPLLGLDNFLLTSHIGSRTHEAERRTCAIATDIVLEHLDL